MDFVITHVLTNVSNRPLTAIIYLDIVRHNRKTVGHLPFCLIRRQND